MIVVTVFVSLSVFFFFFFFFFCFFSFSGASTVYSVFVPGWRQYILTRLITDSNLEQIKLSFGHNMVDDWAIELYK